MIFFILQNCHNMVNFLIDNINQEKQRKHDAAQLEKQLKHDAAQLEKQLKHEANQSKMNYERTFTLQLLELCIPASVHRGLYTYVFNLIYRLKVIKEYDQM